MKLTFLGQAGFLIETQETSILIDPYLSNYVVEGGIGDATLFSRTFPPPKDPATILDIDAVFCTHDHADHCDPLTILPILANNPDCRLFGPQPVLDHLLKVGVDSRRLALAQAFKSCSIGSIHFTAIPSAHYGLEQNRLTGEYPYLGFVFETGNITLYHSGDTILYDGLVETLRKISSHYEVCCLPVNGRDARREALGMIGNLLPEESLELAAQLGAQVLIPMHNDLFAANSLDPQILKDAAFKNHPTQTIHWMKPGESISYQ